MSTREQAPLEREEPEGREAVEAHPRDARAIRPSFVLRAASLGAIAAVVAMGAVAGAQLASARTSPHGEKIAAPLDLGGEVASAAFVDDGRFVAVTGQRAVLVDRRSGRLEVWEDFGKYQYRCASSGSYVGVRRHGREDPGPRGRDRARARAAALLGYRDRFAFVLARWPLARLVRLGRHRCRVGPELLGVRPPPRRRPSGEAHDGGVHAGPSPRLRRRGGPRHRRVARRQHHSGRFRQARRPRARDRCLARRKLIATGGCCGHDTIQLWDASTAKLVGTLEGHKGPITALRFTPQGALVSGSKDQTLRVWDPATGKELRRMRENRGPWGQAQVWGIDLDSDGTRALVANQSSVLEVWDLESGREIR